MLSLLYEYIEFVCLVTRPDVPPYNEWMLLAYILVPLFGICCLVICGFYLYRRHKLFEDMDGVSVVRNSS